MQLFKSLFYSLFCLLFISLFFSTFCAAQNVELIMPTFLGNWQRNYYGKHAPDSLKTIWRTYLGKGKTVISKKIGEKEWAGTGWTGQCLLVKEENKGIYLIIGCYDHHLKKIDAKTGNIIWQYRFDDVIKGTGTIWHNHRAASTGDAYVIMQGSRRGLENDLFSRIVPSFRGISYHTGKELWRMNVAQTASYSRDVDGSALVVNDTAYIGLENGLFTVFSPNPDLAEKGSPTVYQQIQMFDRKDIRRHGGNLVIESSPALLNNHIYVTSGSGHVYGYNLDTREIDWDFYIGADMDGSPVVTSDSCLIVTIEKQYIDGHGGALKLNPKRKPESAVEWFFPTMDDSLLSWAGGVIGSAAINDVTRPQEQSYLCAFSGIDGYLYVVDHKNLDENADLVLGPNNKQRYPVPRLIYKHKIGPSISTPIFSGNKLIAAGYHGIYLFDLQEEQRVSLIDRRQRSAFESTPIVHDGYIYIGARDGYLYCFGQRK
jgi:outer membrane protein assembly factor BamB